MSIKPVSREWIQQLLNRVDIVDLIDSRVPLRKKSSNNYFACCPFHTEKSASFSVSQNKQFYYCFGCGAHGNAIDFLMQYEHLPFPEAIESLAKQAGIEIPEEQSYRKSVSHADDYELLSRIANTYQNELRQSQPAIDYLKKRGITGQIAKTFKIGFAPKGFETILKSFGATPELKKQLHELGMLVKKDNDGYYDRFRERIMFPIHDRRGRTVGFGGRVLGEETPKYLNSPETRLFQKGHELYGLYYALKAHRPLDKVLIVEGYMDVISLFEQGITYAVGTLGTATTEHHIKQLTRHTAQLIFCFDGDPAGRAAAKRALFTALPLMQDGLQIQFMFLPDGEDPDSLIRKEGKTAFETRAREAMPLSQFFFQALGTEIDLGHVDGRARLASLATEHLNQLPPGIFQKMMFDELAKITRFDISAKITTATTKPLKKTPRKIRPLSPLRLAFTLLVQQPALAHTITETLPPLDLQGFSFFIEILNVIKEKTIATTGALLEYFRDHPESHWLVRFARTEHTVPHSGTEHEFKGAIFLLKNMARDQMIQQLLLKGRVDPLSSEEKKQLQQLIQCKNEDRELQ